MLNQYYEQINRKTVQSCIIYRFFPVPLPLRLRYTFSTRCNRSYVILPDNSNKKSITVDLLLQ